MNGAKLSFRHICHRVRSSTTTLYFTAHGRLSLAVVQGKQRLIQPPPQPRNGDHSVPTPISPNDHKPQCMSTPFPPAFNIRNTPHKTGTPVKRLEKKRRDAPPCKGVFLSTLLPPSYPRPHIQPNDQRTNQSIDRTTNFSAIASCVRVRLLRYETMSRSCRLSSKSRLNASGRILGTAASVSASCRAKTTETMSR